MSRWSSAQVSGAAPDASSLQAGQKLAGNQSVWSDTGCADTLVWGSCQGSGKNPYRILVDTAGPRYKCSCPSRKFPCKHAIGLLILWSENRLPSDQGAESQIPQGAADWLGKGSQNPAAATPQAAEEPDSPETAAQKAEQQAKRRAQREDRITDGLEDLERWLCDQVETGFARAWTDPYKHFDAAAARLVDAQAGGLANRVRELPAIAASGDGWPQRLLIEFARLHLACRAWPHRDSLPEPLAQTLRTVVGIPVPTESVAETPGLRTRWFVAGLRDLQEGKLNSRRVWLYRIDAPEIADQARNDGMGTWSPWASRWMSVISFTPSGQARDTSLAPGTVVDALAHRYPGCGNWRGLLSKRFADLPLTDAPGWQPTVLSLQQQAAEHRALLAQNPWASVSPASVRVRVVPDPWLAQDQAGDQVRLLGEPGDLAKLHGLLAGDYGQVLGEWSATGFGDWSGIGLRPTGVVTDTGLELL
jgi:hypothetical protein